MIGSYYYGTGRRKSSVARVFIKAGKGDIIVNNKPVDLYFSRETGRMIVRQPLELTNNVSTFDITVSVGKTVCTSAAARVAMPVDDDDNPWERRAERWQPVPGGA